MEDFLRENPKTYRHIFMDEAEAICLAFDGKIVQNTIMSIYHHYHAGNCPNKQCNDSTLKPYENLTDKLAQHQPKMTDWGELWFMVDINQASIFLPKHSPQMLKTPDIVLSKVMRCTERVFNVFKQFYSMPLPLLPKKLMDNMNIPNITIGHHILGILDLFGWHYLQLCCVKERGDKIRRGC